MKYLVLLLTMVIPFSTQADNTLAEELITVLKTDQRAYDSFSDRLSEKINKGTESRQYYLCIKNLVTKEHFRDSFIPIYQKNFTQEEAQTIISFMTSNIGKRVMNSTEDLITQEDFKKSLSKQDAQQLIDFGSSSALKKLKESLDEAMGDASERLGLELGLQCRKSLVKRDKLN